MEIYAWEHIMSLSIGFIHQGTDLDQGPFSSLTEHSYCSQASWHRKAFFADLWGATSCSESRLYVNSFWFFSSLPRMVCSKLCIDCQSKFSLHLSHRFRTQFCGRGIHCSQPFCFFAHSMAELRHPSTDFAEMQQDGSSRTPSIISDTPPKDINNIAQLSR